MAKQPTARVTVPAQAAAKLFDNQLSVAIIGRMYQDGAAITEAMIAVDRARFSQMASLMKGLENVAPVDEAKFDLTRVASFTAWAKGLGCEISETVVKGKTVHKAVKGNEVVPYAATSFSAFKVAVIGLTNRGTVDAHGYDALEPQTVDGVRESFQSYVKRVRPIVIKRGLLADRSKAPRTPTGKDPKRPVTEAAPAPKPSMADAFAMVAHGNQDLADAMAWAGGEGRALFMAWYAKTQAILNA